MASYNQLLLTILLILCSVLVIFLIVVCIKLLYTTDRINIILSDVEKKLKSVNGVFSLIDNVTDTLSTFSDAVILKIISLVQKIFNKKEKE